MADKKRKNTPLWEADEDVNDNIKKYYAKDENFEQPKNAHFESGANEAWLELFKKIFGWFK